MDLAHYLTKQSQKIEQCLQELIPERNVPYNSLFQAARYSLLGGGKRLRPILALAATESLGGDCQIALKPSCALELIHTYSLIHDDLPCMDDDDYRRGKPSLHKAFPEGHAVLTGDYLLTYAFDILAHDSNLSSEKKIKLISVLTRRSGGDGMIAGQVLDVAAESKAIDLQALDFIHLNKTGAMIMASLEFGAIIADAKPEHYQILKQFGCDLGLAFQIIDDVLDVTASKQKHGREVASDVINEKMTYVKQLGIEKSQKRAHELFQSALQQIRRLPFDVTMLEKLAENTVYRKS